MSKVSIHLPEVPKGAEVEVAFLGLFKNGETTTLKQEQVDQWCAVTGREWPKSGTLSIPDQAPVEDQDDTAQVAESKKEGKG